MKYVAFLETNSSGTGFEAIKKLQVQGFKVVFLTQEEEFYKGLEQNPLEIADIVLHVNTSCVASILNILSPYRLSGIVALDDYRLVTAAVVAQYLGLNHQNIQALLRCRFKDQTRRYVHNGKVSYYIGNLDEDLDHSRISYPCVFKPCDDSGSLGVQICYNRGDLTEAQRRFEQHRVNARGYERSSRYLVEEYIEGQEYSAELVWDENKKDWHWLGLTQKKVTTGEYAVELGHDFPVILPRQNDIKKVVMGWLRDVGLSATAVHLEFKISDQGLHLIEINPRPGGGMIHYLCCLTTGWDIIDMYLQALVEGYYAHQSEAIYPSASIRFLMPTRIGKVDDIILPPNYTHGHPLIVNLKALPCQVESLSSSYARLGYVIYGASSVQESSKAAESYITAIQLKMGKST